MITSKLSLRYILENMVAEGTENDNLLLIDRLLKKAVIGRSSLTPGLPNHLDMYLVIATATGFFAGHEDELAIWIEPQSSWDFINPVPGMIIWDETTEDYFYYNGTNWGPFVLGVERTVNPALLGGIHSGSPVQSSVALGGNAWQLWEFDPDTDGEVSFVSSWPSLVSFASGWKGRIHASGPSTDVVNKDTAWDYSVRSYSDGDDLNSSGDVDTESPLDSQNKVADSLFLHKGNLGSSPAGAGSSDLFVFSLRRDADNGSDSYPSATRVHSFTIQYSEVFI